MIIIVYCLREGTKNHGFPIAVTKIRQRNILHPASQDRFLWPTKYNHYLHILLRVYLYTGLQPLTPFGPQDTRQTQFSPGGKKIIWSQEQVTEACRSSLHFYVPINAIFWGMQTSNRLKLSPMLTKLVLSLQVAGLLTWTQAPTRP